VTLRLITDASSGPQRVRAPAAGELDPGAFERLFAHAGGMLAVLDRSGRFVAVNAACERVLGHSPELLVGQSLLDHLHPHEPSPALGSLAGSGTVPEGFVEVLGRHRHCDGGWRWLLWSGSSDGTHWYASARDVTDWIRLEDEAGRDPLTTLANREAFTGELTRALARHERTALYVGVVFVDVDCFKQINDSLGHEAGDALLGEIAARLREAVRGGDLVGRLGGDEFVILLESLQDPAEAVSIGERILALLEPPAELGFGPLAVSASLGIATARSGATNARRLVHEADIAMYRAKAAGRGRLAVFDLDLRADVQRRLDTERELRNALAAEELELHYQPIVSLAGGAPLGCEALLRWPRDGRLVAPSEFVPLAEQSGLIIPLGAWVLDAAIREAAAWHAAGHPLTVAVNLSAHQLSDETLDGLVASLLDRHGLPSAALCLEVTETAVLRDPAAAATALAALRERGVRIAIDDFGTGYSSLRHLSDLPVDIIKLDRTFVAGLSGARPQRSRAILMAAAAASRELGIDLIAEGVEDERQLETLREVGCAWAQGHLFSPALPASQLELATLDPRACGA
jgi:diguanylate cyclase (GGDEF)-like protein/PAS domain S-box-containing protein